MTDTLINALKRIAFEDGVSDLAGDPSKWPSNIAKEALAANTATAPSQPDYVRVPKEPTEQMMAMGGRSLINGQDSRPGTSWAEEAAMAYRAMIAAAPVEQALIAKE